MEAQQGKQDHGGGERKIMVAISTTAGFFPAEGFDEIPENQKVEVQLGKAAKKLNITNTTGWVATVKTSAGKKTIVVANSYAESGLIGEVTIDWGPSEGGGGASSRR